MQGGAGMDLINVVVCPHCGDMWITDNINITTECLCFRCNKTYIPNKVYKMDKWIYNLVKTVKGH